MLHTVKIGKTLRATREAQFLTQEQLSQRTGLSRDTLSRIERNMVEPRFSTILRLAEKLNVEPGSLVDKD